MNQPKIYPLTIAILLFVIFLFAYNRMSYSQIPQPQDSLKPLNLGVPQSSQGNPNQNPTDSWTLDFPDETGVTERRIIPSFSSLSACRAEGNRLSPNDYFCSRNCKSVNAGGTNVGQELCDVSCTATRCNYVNTGKPYTE